MVATTKKPRTFIFNSINSPPFKLEINLVLQSNHGEATNSAYQSHLGRASDAGIKRLLWKANRTSWRINITCGSCACNLHNNSSRSAHIYKIASFELRLPDLFSPFDTADRDRCRLGAVEPQHRPDASGAGVQGFHKFVGAIDYSAARKALKASRFGGDVEIEQAHLPNFQLTRPRRENWKICRD